MKRRKWNWFGPTKLGPKVARRLPACSCGGLGGRSGMHPVCVTCLAYARYARQLDGRRSARGDER